jgi:predicted RNA binding protein YcfA (HicA-like mRNA interferase family)
MKLPRGISADRLIRALERLGYTVIRQKGSHIRLFH